MIGRRVAGALLLLLAAAGRGAGQPSAAPPSAAPPSAAPPSAAPARALTVTLVTFGHGDDVVTHFGHDALWFHDAATGADVAYHWGLFDFNDPGFVRRFVAGEPRYAMGGEDPIGLIERERGTGRSVTLQRLALRPDQADALLAFVRWNARPENRYYRYDYYRDNCATRLRDALDRALGGALRARFGTARTTLTYRGESLRLTNDNRPAQLGIDLALGRPADTPLTAWESFFIPMRLRDALRGVRLPDATGAPVPLVAQERLLPPLPGASVIAEPADVPSLAARYLVCGLVLAALAVALRVMMVTRRGAAWGLALYAAAWWLVCGVLGVLIGLAWIATHHVYWARNETLLLLTPLCLALVVLAPMALLSGRAVRAARGTAAAVALLGLAAAVLALVPGGQQSGALVGLLLPPHLALAWALGVGRARGTT